MKLKYSALLSDARGILNGSYASRDRYGAVLRNRVIPRNPQSQKQQMMRNTFSYVARRWRTISQHCRDEWTVYARTYPYKDVFGDRKFLQPNALFIQSNMNNLLYGFPFLECPEFENVEFPDFPILIEAPNLGEIIVSYPTIKDLPHTLVLQATKPTKKKKNNIENDFVTIAVLNESDFVNGKYNARDDYLAVFGEYGNDETIYFQYFFADKSGRVSLPQISKEVSNTEMPLIKDFEWRTSEYWQSIFMRAQVLNQEALTSGKWKLYIGVNDNHDYCPLELHAQIEDGPIMDALLAGQEFELPYADPYSECVLIGFIAHNTETNERVVLDKDHVNLLDLPYEDEYE